MDNDEIERLLLKQSRRRWPWVLLAVVLVLAGAFGVMRYVLHRRVEAKLTDLRAAGYPTTLAEVDAWYPTPTGPNAADVYQGAFDAYVEDEELEALLPRARNRDVDFPAAGEPLPAEMAEAMEAYVALNAQTLALLDDAAAIPECRYPVDLTRGFEAVMPHVGKLRPCAELLVFRATLEAGRGQSDRAAKSVKSVLALAGSVRNEPMLISLLVRTSIEALGRRAVERMLGQAGWTDEQLADLSRAFADTIDEGAMPRAVAGERALGLGAWDMLASESGFAALAGFSGLADADRMAYLRIMGENVALAEDPIGHAVDIDAMVRETPQYCFVTRAIVPAMGAAIANGRQADAETRMVLVALAVKRHQLAHGKLPEGLDELVPDYLDAVPIDPFDGKPLRYEPTDTGAIVYSVGTDGIDDGGEEQDAQGSRFQVGTDIVFTIRR